MPQRKFSMAEVFSSHGKLAAGSSAWLSLVVGTFIMHFAAMEEKGVWSLAKMKSWSTDLISRHQLSITPRDESGTVIIYIKLHLLFHIYSCLLELVLFLPCVVFLSMFPCCMPCLFCYSPVSV